MNALALLLAGGGVAAYFWLRPKDAHAAEGPPQAPSTPTPQTPPPSARAERVAAVLAKWPAKITTGTSPLAPEVPSPTPASPLILPGAWGWPVPRWGDRAPVISDGFGSPRPEMRHMGVDLMFARIASDRFPVGSPNATKVFVMPDGWMAVAAGDGILWSSGYTPRGFAVVIDHGTVSTFYTHLDTLLVPQVKPPTKGTCPANVIPIKAGQPLGVIGADPQDKQRLKHLHFELWRGGPQDAIDPAPLMKSWRVFTPSDLAPFLPSFTRNAKRKAKDDHPGVVDVRGHQRRWPRSALEWR
jgi:murein DD-endopeptidase MepM/ murein hydrolase activator NlpD